MSVKTGPCKDCGVPVTRPLLTGSNPFAALMERLPLWCDRCIDRAEFADGMRQEEEAQDDARTRHEQRLKQSGLPAKHRIPLGELEHPPAVVAAAREWAENGGGLLLTGDVGRGKTTIAGAAAWLRLESRPVVWTSAPLLFARLGSGLGTEERAWALDVLASRVSLVLDDIDKARPTQYGAEQVFLAVDQRVEHEAALLVTSNLSPSLLAERWPDPYGEAIASRLVGYCKVVRVDGRDRRLTYPAERLPQTIGGN